jgi:hypothetical protein
MTCRAPSKVTSFYYECFAPEHFYETAHVAKIHACWSPTHACWSPLTIIAACNPENAAVCTCIPFWLGFSLFGHSAAYSAGPFWVDLWAYRAHRCMVYGESDLNRRLAGVTTRIALVGALETLAARQRSQDRRKTGLSIRGRSDLSAEMLNELGWQRRARVQRNRRRVENENNGLFLIIP